MGGLAGRVVGLHPGRRLRVAVDGVDGAGKTVFAGAVVEAVRGLGREAVGVSIDGFHRPAEERYARGRGDPVGFYRDSYDLAGLRSELLDSFGPEGDGRYRTAIRDVARDAAIELPLQQAGATAVLVVDGIFLQRAELEGCWDLTVWLDVPFAETYRRMAERDGCDADPDHPGNARYRQGQQLYLDDRDPAGRADVVVDNTDPARPTLLLTYLQE